MRRAIAGIALALVMALLPGVASPAQAAVPGPQLTIRTTTWNMIGLDSNKPSITNGRPNEFPVNVEICNVGESRAVNLRSSWNWLTSTTSINLASPGMSTRTLDELAPGACTSVTYNVVVNRNQQSFTNRTRSYQVTATADGATSVSTPASRELYVERLVSQNRNAVVGITSPACSGGSCMVYRGGTYRFSLAAKTATQGYEQLQAFINFSDSVFEIKKVETTYASPAGGKNSGIYADACGWDGTVGSPTYRTCVGPTNYPGGKAGGNPIKTIYTVKVIGTGSGTLSGLIYDFSGSSFHYNGDYGTGVNAVPYTAVDASDLSLRKTHQGAFVRDATGTYTLTATNGGPSASGAVTITDTLPTGLTYKNFVGSGWSCSSCSASSQTVTLTRSALAAGASSSVDLIVDVGPLAGGSLTNSAVVSQPSSATLKDPDLGNNRANDPTTIANPNDADLVLIKEGPDELERGGEGTYLLRTRNDGPSPAVGPLTLIDVLPPGVDFVSASGTGWTCSASGQNVTCTYASGLNAYELTAPLSMTVAATDAAATRMTNSTSVTADVNNDPNPSNNIDVLDQLLIGRADLKIEKSHHGSFSRGGQGEYKIVVSNAGPDRADTPRVVDTLPPGLTYLSGAGSGWTCSSSAQTVVCDSDSDLPAASSSAPLTIRVNVAENAGRTVTNAATVCSATRPISASGCPDQQQGTPEVDAMNNTVEDVTETLAPTDLSLSKTVSTPWAAAGDSFTYTLTATNHGPNTATNVTVVDQLPTYIDPASISTSPGSSNTSTPPYCETTNLEVTCMWAAVSPSAGSNSVTATITAKARPTAAGRTLVNTASVYSEQGDGNPANDTGKASISITGTLVNNAPTASDVTAGTPHLRATGVDISLSGTDGDGDPLTYHLVGPNGGAAHGTVSVAGNIAIYVPTGDYIGTDTFQYRSNDGAQDSSAATATVNLTDSVPTLEAASLSPTSVSSSGSIVATAVGADDADGDPLSYNFVWKRTSEGVTSQIASTTSPSATDSLDLSTLSDPPLTGDTILVEITAHDGHNASPTRTTSATVSEAPSASAQDVTTPEDVAKAISLADGSVVDELTYTIRSLPQHGMLHVGGSTSGDPIEAVPTTLTQDAVTYSPDGDFNGDDSFEFSVSTRTHDSDLAEIDLEVTPVNDAPTTNDGGSIAIRGGADVGELDVASLVHDLETNDANLTYRMATDPARGDAIFDGSTVTYTRTGDRSSDSFTFDVVDRGDPDGCTPESQWCDAGKNSNTSTIEVTFGNAQPEVDPQHVTTEEDVELPLTLTGTDGDNDELSFEIVSLPQHGTLHLGDNKEGDPISSVPTVLGSAEVTYLPEADYSGPDSFDFKATDGALRSDASAVTIDVTPLNDPPVAKDDAYEMEEGAILKADGATPSTGGVLSNDSDPEGDTLTVADADPDATGVQPVTYPLNGTLELSSDGSFEYTAAPGFAGEITFIYQACDLTDCDTATATVSVSAVRRLPPTVRDDFGSTGLGEVVSNAFVSQYQTKEVTARTKIYKIDAGQQPYGFVKGTNAVAGPLNALGFRSTDHSLYGYRLQGKKGIVRINPTTRATTYLGHPKGLPASQRYFAGDVSPDGTTYYVYKNRSGVLWKVDLDSFKASSVQLDQKVRLLDMAASPVDGHLYGVSPLGEVVRLHPGSGRVVTREVAYLTPGTYGAIWFTAAGDLIAFENGKVGGHGTLEWITTPRSTPTIVTSATVPATKGNDGAAYVAPASPAGLVVHVDVLANDQASQGELDPSTLRILASPSHGTANLNEDGTVTYTSSESYEGQDLFEYEVCDDGGVPECGTGTVSISSSRSP